LLRILVRGKRGFGCANPLRDTLSVIRTTAGIKLSTTAAMLLRFPMESLILAQNERWRQASYMQVERTYSFGSTLAANG